jgi:hypothetical protein
MSLKTQKANMSRLGHLLLQRVSRSYEAKSEFMRKAAAFCRGLAKDLGFCNFKIVINKGGNAISGEVSIYGVWQEGNGLFIEVSQMSIKDAGIMYRAISDINGAKCRKTHFISTAILLGADYGALLKTFLVYREWWEKQKYIA